MTADTDISGAITTENLAKVIANLDDYIEVRAGRMAEAALAREKTDADARVKATREDLGRQLERQTSLVVELRRQLEVCVRQLDRIPELADALGVPRYTPWELLIAKARELAEQAGPLPISRKAGAFKAITPDENPHSSDSAKEIR